MKNIHNSTKQNIFRCLALFLIILGAFVCTNFSFAQTVTSAYAQDYTIVGNMTNNVVFVNFKGEDSSYDLYKNSYTTFDTLFNSGEYSVKNYYLANSNNKLNMTADIISSNDQDITIYTATKERTYYMPYMIKKNGMVELNTDGYFDYYLIKGTNWDITSDYDTLMMYVTGTLVAKVYKLNGAPVDSDPSDKIMSYDEAVEYATANSCTVVSSFERYFREYELLCDIMEQAGSSIDDTNSDRDSDKTVDCLSYALLNDQTASTYNIQHADLLWPHMGNIAYLNQYSSYLSPIQTQLKSKLVNEFDFNSSDVDTLLGYVQNKPTTKCGLTFGNVYMSDYDMNDLATQTKWESFVLDNTTECHELGHILGLGDLYLGSSDTSLVGSWSHMCDSHQYYASFFTSYEREKLGWLDSTNIGTIEYKGEYTIQKVKGKDGNNRIAYKYNVPNTNEAVYFEYRAPNNVKGFDDFCGYEPGGLLVYTTNTTELTDNQFSGNNQAKNYYEIYVNRKNSVDVYHATLGLNESMGSLDKSTTTDAILHSMKTDGTYKNSGLSVVVTAINDDSLTFKILSNDLQSKNLITKEQLGGNATLYNKLLSQANDTSELTSDSFQGVEKLDVSECNLSDLTFLDLFDLSSVKYINLCDNNLQYNSINTTKLIGYSFSKVYLSNNFINLKNISSSLITNSIFEWGLQKTTTDTVFVNDSLTILYYYSSSSSGIVKLNGTALDACPTSAIEYTLNEFGECKFVVEFSDGIFASAKYEYTVTNISITSKYASEANTIKVIKDASLPSFENLIVCKGISASLVKMVGQYPSTSAIGISSFNLLLNCNGESLSVVVYYEVFNVKIEFVGTESVYAIGETYTEQYIKIYENDTLQDYKIEDKGNKKTYYINYYVLDGETRNTTPKITTAVEAEFVVEYVITTSFDEQIIKERHIVVSDDIIKQESMDTTLYSELSKITNKDYVYKSDFSTLQNIDLSNKGLTSIKGLNLILVDTMIINLCDNNLNDLTELDNIRASSNAKLLLIFNNFENIVGDYSNCVFGLQNIQRTYLSSNNKVEIADIYEDFATYFDLTFGEYEIISGTIWQKTFGTNLACRFTLKGTSISYQKLVDNIYIDNKENEIVKEFSDTFLYNFDNLFEVKGTNSGALDISNNYQSIVSLLSKVGTYTLESVFTYNGQKLQQDITIKVVNTRELTKVSEAEKEIYIQNQRQYDELFASDECVYFDEYEQRQIKVKGQTLTLSGYGAYNVEFSAKASSGKITKYTRVVHYGDVQLNATSSKEQYNTAFELPLKIFEFTNNDLKISYKYDNGQWQEYNNGVSLKKYGDIDLTVQVVHSKNNDIVYNFSYLVKIVDETSPQITLIGAYTITNWAGQNYVEAGYKVSDNSTLQVLTNQNESEDLSLEISYLYKAPNEDNFVQVKGIDNTKIGTYKIKYKATDNAGNVAKEERIINIVYAPVEQIEINEKLLLTQYSQNKKVEFYANVISDYITDPDVKLNWYVNDELINCVGGAFAYTFKDAGEYTIYATLSTDESIGTQVATITVYAKSEYENLVLYIGLGLGAVTVIGFGAFFISVYRKRNFY